MWKGGEGDGIEGWEEGENGKGMGIGRHVISLDVKAIVRMAFSPVEMEVYLLEFQQVVKACPFNDSRGSKQTSRHMNTIDPVFTHTL